MNYLDENPSNITNAWALRSKRQHPGTSLNSPSGKQQPLMGDISALTLMLDTGFLCKYPLFQASSGQRLKRCGTADSQSTSMTGGT